MTKRKVKGKRKLQGRTVSSGAYSNATFTVALKQINIDASAIVQQIIDHMQVTAAVLGKSFSPGAFNEWRPKLLEAVKVKLTLGGNWNADKANVLEVARDLTAIAVLLSGNGAQVAKARLHASFRACKEHAKCPVAGGSGAWCNFDI